MGGKGQGKGKTASSSSQQQKRPRASSGNTDDDAESLIDTVLGALSDKDTMERFISSLCAIPDVKSKLVEHLLPSLRPTLNTQVADILKPLKESVSELETKLQSSSDRCKELALKNDDLEQYTRRKNVRVTGFPEHESENTDELIINFAKNALDIDICLNDIDRSHRVGKKSTQNTPRPIIVRFVSFRTKAKFMKSRKSAKNFNQANHTAHFINEDLTKKRSSVAFEARRLKRDGIISDTWIYDGKVFVKDLNDKITVCNDASKLPSRPD